MAFDPAPAHADAPTDADLLARVVAQDGRRRDAVAQLHQRHGAAVYRYAWLVTSSEALAADVVQDTFLAVLDEARGFDPQRGSCAAWLCGIARHLAWRRFDSRTTAVEDIESVHEGAAAEGALDLPTMPEDALERAQALARLHEAIRALPPHYRDVLVLVELQEMSYADAALVTGIELGTVRSRLARARARLVELLRATPAIGSKV